MKKKFYITTTLPYVNAEPHIGFALEIVQADAVARYHRLQNEDVFFNTGTDEHGQKVYNKALEEGKKPQEYVDKYARKFDNLKKALNLSYNNFIRTTDRHHIEAAKEFWKRCRENGDIYKAKQKIKYCVGCELEKTESELIDNRCPIHPNLQLEVVEEENYFFRFSKYEKKLLKLYKENPDFVIPKSRLKEIGTFVSGGLKDFSASRLKKKMPWGVDVPNDPNHVMYVWFDALVNYISAIGWPKDIKSFKNWWPGIQVAGKDNLRQQSAMWQAMLMSAGLPNSKQILIHGFITSEGQKMSKSLGNVVDPFEVVKKYGTDAVRYYLLREISPTKDGDFSTRRFEELYNADLANGLGNLVARVAKLFENNELEISTDLSIFPSLESNRVLQKIEPLLSEFKFNEALEYIWQALKNLDVYLNKEKPWELTKSAAKKKLKKIITGSTTIVSLLDIAQALTPFLPETAEKIKKQFKGPKIKSQRPLFPRIK
jgi:methionyl-tRNA synthetase